MQTLGANSTILKVIWVIKIRISMLLTFGQFLGHKSLNLGPNDMGPKLIES